LIGATDQPVQLVGDPVRVGVPIDERAAQSVQANARGADLQGRAFLDIEDIDAERNPGKIYNVYVNLPDPATPADLTTHHVGNVSLFGVERARSPRGDEHAHSLRISIEITDLLNRLAADGTWQKGTELRVTFLPVSLIPPDEPVAGPAVEDTAHPEQPITIGRVSVHFA
jgi:tyrosinase